MTLSPNPPVLPMEALSVEDIPTGPDWQYEPKWDGFRCLLFRDGEKIELQSKSGKPLTRYFPEVQAAARNLAANNFVLDGELVVPVAGCVSLDALLQRIHPASRRVNLLSKETPALLIVFDLLSEEGRSLLNIPLRDRRARLEAFSRNFFSKRGTFRLSPATTVLRNAKRWLDRVGSALDGIVAKRLDMPYRPGKRDGMQKIKYYRSADCVVGGFRFAEGRSVVGSLLLGLYDTRGLLDHVVSSSAIKEADKPPLTAKLTPLIAPPGFSGTKPGGLSRWSTERSAEWQPLKPCLVVEVCYDHYSDGRFRHGTRLLRWRPDKSPKQCTLDQVDHRSVALLNLL